MQIFWFVISVIFDDKFLLDINNAIMLKKQKLYLRKKEDKSTLGFAFGERWCRDSWVPQYGDSHRIVKEQLPCIKLLFSDVYIATWIISLSTWIYLPHFPIFPLNIFNETLTAVFRIFLFIFLLQIIDYS